jgi:hypothetical protein
VEKRKMDMRKIGILSVTVLLVALATAATSVATTVTIQSATGQVSEITTVPIMINDVTGVKGAHILLEFDSSVVHALDIGNSAFALETFKEIDNQSGYVRYAVFSLTALNGDVKFADVTLEGQNIGLSPLNLTVVSLDNGTGQIPRDVVNGTFTVLSDTAAPIVTNPSADPVVIPDDTDNQPTWGELAELNVDVSDESAIDSVIFDLSAIGRETVVGSGEFHAFNIGSYTVDSTFWAVFNISTNASAGTAGWNGGTYVPYCLPVNATDIYGHSNTSVCITLTVMKNGDVDENGAVNLDDGIYIVNYALMVPGYDLIQGLADLDENHGPPNLDDGIFLVNHALMVPGYDILH